MYLAKLLRNKAKEIEAEGIEGKTTEKAVQRWKTHAHRGLLDTFREKERESTLYIPVRAPLTMSSGSDVRCGCFSSFQDRDDGGGIIDKTVASQPASGVMS